jgi:hypothetical protein
MLLRVSVDFIEYIGVSPKRAKTGIGAKQNFPSAIFDMWKICRVGIEKYPPTKSDKFAGTSFILN